METEDPSKDCACADGFARNVIDRNSDPKLVTARFPQIVTYLLSEAANWLLQTVDSPEIESEGNS